MTIFVTNRLVAIGKNIYTEMETDLIYSRTIKTNTALEIILYILLCILRYRYNIIATWPKRIKVL